MTQDTPEVGAPVWIDLTVPNAEEMRDFYTAVVGWAVGEVDMGGYADFSMVTPDRGTTVAGVCHARGVNADLPPVWLPYFTVADLDASVRQATERGGVIIVAPRSLGDGRFCVVKDPAGAVAALYEV
jgi:predicted enzyme related to lactoylglutathione lyase